MRAVIAVPPASATGVTSQMRNIAESHPEWIGGEWTFDVTSTMSGLQVATENDPRPDCVMVSLQLEDLDAEAVQDLVHEYQVVLLEDGTAGRLSREAKALVDSGFKRIVRGDLPGRRPYTIVDALKEAAGDASGDEGAGDWASLLQREQVTEKTSSRRTRKGAAVLIASSKGGSGKTTIAMSAGVALGVANDVCAWDTNHINPDCAGFLKDHFRENVEVGAEGLMDLPTITPDAVEDYLVAGPGRLKVLPGPSTDFIGSNRVSPRCPTYYEDTLEVLRSKFDLVIVDTYQDWDSEPVQKLASLVDRVYVVLDITKFTNWENQRQAPKLVAVGVRPENIRVIVNKFAKGFQRPQEILRAFTSSFRANVPANHLPRLAGVLSEAFVTYTKAQWAGQSLALTDPQIAREWKDILEDMLPGASVPQAGQAKRGVFPWRR